MQVDLLKKSVTLSVGELSDFSIGPAHRMNRRSGQWRTLVGIQWHQEQEKVSKEAGENGQFEVTLRGVWPYKGWKFNIQGRIDQWIEEKDRVLIREIKTTSFELPADTDELIDNFRPYFAQLGIYLVLLQHKKTQALPFTGELLFINIDDGIRQHVSDDQHCIDLFHTQIDALWQYVDTQKIRSHKFQTTKPVSAYTKLRDGQETIQDDLLKAATQSPVVYFQAPTGYGKTGVALEYALNQVLEGNSHQIVYLTSKSSGQHQVMKQLESMLPQGSILSALQIRNKDELCNSPLCRCDPDDNRFNSGDRWKRCGLSPKLFLESATDQPKLFRQVGEKETLCPYELMRATLPYADLWVGDINYLFSPRNRSLFFEQPGFDLSKTLLILDEAHNLASRVADVFSYQVSHDDLEQWHAELQFTNGHPRIRKALEAWLDMLEKLSPSDTLTDLIAYEARDCAEQLAAALQAYPLQGKLLSEDALHAIWELADTESFFKNVHLEKLIWCSRPGRLNLSCLDASNEIGSILSLCQHTILMSATLEPRPYFLKQHGLIDRKTRPIWVEANTPWRMNAYDCAIDLRVDTRYKARKKHHLTTVETLASCVQSTNAPVVVFFPSYKYADTIRQLADNEFPHLSVAMQQRGGNPEAQTRFIDESISEADLIFLILGSGFAEGIDHLGGHIELAIIVGPALPEVNAMQNKRMTDRNKLGREAAFEEVYQIPGMQKINQALGRLVRAPGQSARILFHCKRFAESSYQELLMEDFRSDKKLFNTDNLVDWLADR